MALLLLLLAALAVLVLWGAVGFVHLAWYRVRHTAQLVADVVRDLRRG